CWSTPFSCAAATPKASSRSTRAHKFLITSNPFFLPRWSRNPLTGRTHASIKQRTVEFKKGIREGSESYDQTPDALMIVMIRHARAVAQGEAFGSGETSVPSDGVGVACTLALRERSHSRRACTPRWKSDSFS